jgi:hypothetical protein
MVNGMRGLSLLAVLALPWPAAAEPRARIGAFTCRLEDDRAHLRVPRSREASSGDELECRAELWGVSRGPERFVGEIRIRVPGRPTRTVAAGAFRPVEGSRDRAALTDVFVPHTTWFPGVSWTSARAPRLRLALVVFHRPEPDGRWQVIATRDLELGAGRRAKVAASGASSPRRRSPGSAPAAGKRSPARAGGHRR